MGPRDPFEREMLCQRGDPLALREDPGWLKLAGARALAQPEPLDLEATRIWLASEATLQEADAWVRARTELRQRVNPALPLGRDQVRWALPPSLRLPQRARPHPGRRGSRPSGRRGSATPESQRARALRYRDDSWAVDPGLGERTPAFPGLPSGSRVLRRGFASNSTGRTGRPPLNRSQIVTSPSPSSP